MLERKCPVCKIFSNWCKTKLLFSLYMDAWPITGNFSKSVHFFSCFTASIWEYKQPCFLTNIDQHFYSKLQKEWWISSVFSRLFDDPEWLFSLNTPLIWCMWLLFLENTPSWVLWNRLLRPPYLWETFLSFFSWLGVLGLGCFYFYFFKLPTTLCASDSCIFIPFSCLTICTQTFTRSAWTHSCFFLHFYRLLPV